MSANVYLPPSPVVPGMLLIEDISNSYPMVITITDSIYNTYVVGMLVTLAVPASYGMFQANNRTGQIVAINGDDFSVNIDSRGFDVFTPPSPGLPPPSKPASLAPGGSRNIYNTAVEPFHSLSNQGN